MKKRGKDLKLTRKDDKESHEEGERGSTPDRTMVKKNNEASSSHHVRTASPVGNNALNIIICRRRQKTSGLK